MNKPQGLHCHSLPLWNSHFSHGINQQPKYSVLYISKGALQFMQKILLHLSIFLILLSLITKINKDKTTNIFAHLSMCCMKTSLETSTLSKFAACLLII